MNRRAESLLTMKCVKFDDYGNDGKTGPYSHGHAAPTSDDDAGGLR